MNRTILCARSLVMSSLFVAALSACGGAPAPAPPPAPSAEAPKPGPSAAATANADDGAKKEAIAQCLASANYKRAKSSFEPPKIVVKHVLVKFKGSKGADGSVTR